MRYNNLTTTIWRSLAICFGAGFLFMLALHFHDGRDHGGESPPANDAKTASDRANEELEKEMYKILKFDMGLEYADFLWFVIEEKFDSEIVKTEYFQVKPTRGEPYEHSVSAAHRLDGLERDVDITYDELPFRTKVVAKETKPDWSKWQKYACYMNLNRTNGVWRLQRTAGIRESLNYPIPWKCPESQAMSRLTWHVRKPTKEEVESIRSQ